MSIPVVLTDEPAAHVRRISLNRPEKRNALNHALRGGIIQALQEADQDSEIRVMIVRGAGKCFSAGASVAEHKQEQAEAMLDTLLEACNALAELHVPTVALVHGPCFGGAMELIAFCDIVVADPEAKLGQPEIKLAFIPPVACLLPLLPALCTISSVIS